MPGLVDWVIVAIAVIIVLAGLRAFRAERNAKAAA